MKVYLEEQKTGPLWRRRTVEVPKSVLLDLSSSDGDASYIEALRVALDDAEERVAEAEQELSKIARGRGPLVSLDHLFKVEESSEHWRSRTRVYEDFLHAIDTSETGTGAVAIRGENAKTIYEGIMYGIGSLVVDELGTHAEDVDALCASIEYVHNAPDVIDWQPSNHRGL